MSPWTWWEKSAALSEFMGPAASLSLRDQRGFQILEPMDFNFPYLLLLLVGPNENIHWKIGGQVYFWYFRGVSSAELSSSLWMPFGKNAQTLLCGLGYLMTLLKTFQLISNLLAFIWFPTCWIGHYLKTMHLWTLK